MMALAEATWVFLRKVLQPLKLAGVLIFKMEIKPFLPLLAQISL